MSNSRRPFRSLLSITPESRKLLIFLIILMGLGVGGMYYGVAMKTNMTWLPQLCQAFGTTFLLASLIGLVYELGMRKTTLAEMEKLFRRILQKLVEYPKLEQQLKL